MPALGLFSRLFSRTVPVALPTTFVVSGRGSSIVGRRANNQDAIAVREDLGLFAVADGMGGYEGGEIASRLTIETLERLYAHHREDGDCTWPQVPDGDLSLEAQRAIVAARLAHRAVRAQRHGPLAQMGSTLVAITVEGSRLVVAHAGDSRAYRLRRGELTALTRDHSFLEELAMQRPMNDDERARMEGQFGHVVTRAIGHGDALSPTVNEHAIEDGDRYLLCSDGLSGWLDPHEIAEILTATPIAQAADELTARAFAAGSNDNISAVVLSVGRR